MTRPARLLAIVELVVVLAGGGGCGPEPARKIEDRPFTEIKNQEELQLLQPAPQQPKGRKRR